MWLSYEPARGALDLTSWADILVGHADWPVHGYDTSLTATEVRRRLTVLRGAIEAFIEGPRPPDDVLIRRLPRGPGNVRVS